MHELSTAEVARRLGVTPPTVRQLLKDGAISGRKEQRRTRFSWRISEDSIDSYLTRCGSHRRRGGRRRPASATDLWAEIAALREELQAVAGSLPGSADSLYAELTTMRAALMQQRAITAALQAADDARAAVVQHLLDAVAAGETADQHRREALAAAEGMVGQFVTPGNAASARDDQVKA